MLQGIKKIKENIILKKLRKISIISLYRFCMGLAFATLFFILSCEVNLESNNNNSAESSKTDQNQSTDASSSGAPPLLSFTAPQFDSEHFNLGDFVNVSFRVENKGEVSSRPFQMRYFLSLDQQRDDDDTLVSSPLIYALGGKSNRTFTNEMQIKYSTNVTGLDWYSELYFGYYVKSPEGLQIEGATEGFVKLTFPKFQTRKVVELPQDGPFYFLDSVALANISPNSAFADEIIYTYSGDDVDDPGLYYAKIQTTDYNSIAFAKIQEDAYGTPSIANWNTNNDLLEMGIAEKAQNRYRYFYDDTGIDDNHKFFITDLLFNVPYDTDDDGDIDLVCLADGGTNLYWYSNTSGNGEPSFQRYTIGTNITRKFADMVIGDFNRDGSADLLFSDPLEGSIYHRSGLSGGNGFSAFATATIAGELVGVGPLEIVDFDQDGDLDCLAAIKGEGTNDTGAVYLLRNAGNGLHFGIDAQKLFETPNRIHSFKVADLDGDNDHDIVLTQYDRDRVIWHDNLANNDNISGNDWGTGDFFARPVAFRVEGAYDIDISDFDADGDIDIVAAARKQGAIYIHLNQINETNQ